MKTPLNKWQHNTIRTNIERYRQALNDYYIQSKPLIDVEGGKAFSLLSPPLGSAVTRRRIRAIIYDTIYKNRSEYEDEPNFGRTPHFITIAVTHKCQCSCSHCSASLYKAEIDLKRSYLRVNELKYSIEQALDLGATCVIFTGGEPLLHDSIYQLIEFVDKSKSICTIFTNGEYLNKKNVDRLKEAGIFGVFVSLDYSTSREHDKNRNRKGIFNKAIQGIKLCNTKDILTGISTFVSKEKLLNGELDAMMDLAKEMNVLEVFLFDLIAAGNLQNYHHCMLNDLEIDKLTAFRKKYNDRAAYPRIIHQTMFTSIAYPCVAEGCPAAVAQVHSRNNGDVSPCDFTPLSFGNIRSRSLSEIWKEMISSELYSGHSKKCRLSDKRFWTAIQEK